MRWKTAKPSILLKRAMKGELDLMGPATAVASELLQIPDFGNGSDQLFTAEKKSIADFKKAVLLVAGAAVQKLMMELGKEQEVLMAIADKESAFAPTVKASTSSAVTRKGPIGANVARDFI